MTNKGVALGEAHAESRSYLPPSSIQFSGAISKKSITAGTWFFSAGINSCRNPSPTLAARRDSTNQVLLLHRSGRTGIRFTSAEIIRFRFVDRTILIDINLVEDGPMVL